MKNSRITAKASAFEPFGFSAQPSYHNDDVLKLGRKGVFAGNCRNFNHVHSLEVGHHYNGSGPESFGGAKDWPTVVCTVAFNSGDYPAQERFALELAAFIDSFFKSEGR